MSWTDENESSPQGDWGQGAVNDIGWGQAAQNAISWAVAHYLSWGHAITNLVGSLFPTDGLQWSAWFPNDYPSASVNSGSGLNMIVVNGDNITYSDLTAVTVVSQIGTANIQVVGNELQPQQDGDLFGYELSNGIKCDLLSSGGSTAYDSASIENGVINGATWLTGRVEGEQLYGLGWNQINGTENVVNGDFTTDTNWAKTDGWSISGGQASRVAGVGAANLNQSIAGVVIGERYIIEIDVIALDPIDTGGRFRAQVFGGNYEITKIGMTRLDIVAISGSLVNIQCQTATTTATIDNVSVKVKGDIVIEDLNNLGFDLNGVALTRPAIEFVDNAPAYSNHFRQIEAVANDTFDTTADYSLSVIVQVPTGTDGGMSVTNGSMIATVDSVNVTFTRDNITVLTWAHNNANMMLFTFNSNALGVTDIWVSDSNNEPIKVVPGGSAGAATAGTIALRTNNDNGLTDRLSGYNSLVAGYNRLLTDAEILELYNFVKGGIVASSGFPLTFPITLT